MRSICRARANSAKFAPRRRDLTTGSRQEAAHRLACQRTSLSPTCLEADAPEADGWALEHRRLS